MTTGQGAISEAQGFGARLVRKTVAFDGTSGNGAVGTVNLFTVTGSVIALVIAACTESLAQVADGVSTVEVGIAGTTAGIIAQTTTTGIDAGMIWVDTSPVDLECWTTGFGCMIAGGADIILTVATADVNDGTLVFTCFWTPLTDDGDVVAA